MIKIEYDGTDLQFHIWNGIPQAPKNELEVFTRLGGNKLITQKLRKVANVSSSTAIYHSSSKDLCDAHIDNMLSLVGEKVLLHYFGQEFENLLIRDVTYNLIATTFGDNKYRIEYNITSQWEKPTND